MKWFFDPCRRHRQNLSLLAAGALPEAEKGRIENHLEACANCRKYFEEAKGVTVPLAKLAETFPRFRPSQSAQIRWSKAIMAAGRPETGGRPEPAMAIREWWRDVIWPHRRVWAGLAAVWLVILAGNLSLPGHAQFHAGKPALREAVMSLKDQQRILAELLADHSTPSEAEPRKVFSPSPRTETLMTMTT